jgi:hypothetical protein
VALLIPVANFRRTNAPPSQKELEEKTKEKHSNSQLLRRSRADMKPRLAPPNGRCILQATHRWKSEGAQDGRQQR